METSRTSRTRLTYQDLLQFPDDGRRHELIDGEHYVTPSPNTRHQELSVQLTLALGNHFTRHGGGKVFHAPFDCVFTNFDVVEPDLLVVLSDQIDILTDKHVAGAPAIVVEILSPGTSNRDLGIKHHLYDRGGVCEYWVVDPERDSVEVFRRSNDGTLSKSLTLTRTRGDTLTTSVLPGFALLLVDLFAGASR